MIIAIIQLLVTIGILVIQTAIYLSLRTIVGEPLQWRKPKNDNRYL